MCWSSQTFSIPYVRSWVLRILSGIWYSSTATLYKSTSRVRWSSWTSPDLAPPIDTLSRSCKNLNRRIKTLDLRIRSKGKALASCRTKETSKAGWPKTTRWSWKWRKTPQRQRKTHGNGVSYITAPLTTLVSVETISRQCSSWRLLNEIHVLTLSQRPTTSGFTKGSILLMRSLFPLFPPPR